MRPHARRRHGIPRQQPPACPGSGLLACPVGSVPVSRQDRLTPDHERRRRCGTLVRGGLQSRNGRFRVRQGRCLRRSLPARDARWHPEHVKPGQHGAIASGNSVSSTSSRMLTALPQAWNAVLGPPADPQRAACGRSQLGRDRHPAHGHAIAERPCGHRAHRQHARVHSAPRRTHATDPRPYLRPAPRRGQPHQSRGDGIRSPVLFRRPLAGRQVRRARQHHSP